MQTTVGAFQAVVGAIVDGAFALAVRLSSLRLRTAAQSTVVAHPPSLGKVIVKLSAAEGVEVTHAL